MGQDELTVPSTAITSDPIPNTHPLAFWFFFWGEFAERASYYGMRVILFLYLTNVFRFTDARSTQILSVFKMACYILPLAGGFIADRWLGRYWTIVGFSVPYVLGHFILGIPNEIALGIALALLAGGSGVIKPNISTLMGETYDEQRPGKKLLRSAAFQLFYLSINIGSFLSTLAMPWLRDNYGYAVAFQFPAWLMVGSLAAFALGKKHYALNPPKPMARTAESRREDWRALGRLFGLFALIVFFWAAYEQNDNLWLAFMRDYINRNIGSKEISADQLGFINPLLVIFLIPVFNWMFKRMDPNMVIFTPMRKILAGFLFTAASAGLMSAAGYLAQGHTEQRMVTKMDEESHKPVLDDNNQPVMEEATVCTDKVSILWIILAYVALTVGEVLLYGTALELSYSAAPESMKGMVTACFLGTIMLGNVVNAFWSDFYGGSLKDAIQDRGSIPPGEFFGITAAATVGVSIAFYFVGKSFERGAARAPAVADA